jgi:sporulation related protein
MRLALILPLFILFFAAGMRAQENQTQTQLKVKQAVEKKAEYHRLTGGQQEGYRIKLHFGVDRDKAEATRAKFSARFAEYNADVDYQQPNWVVLAGDFKTKLEAFESLKKIQGEFPNSFIVKGKIRSK